MYENNTLGLSSEWFNNKRAIDVGCGNIGAMMLRLLQLGVSECHGVDIGTDWIESLNKNIQNEGGDSSKIHLKTGSVTQIPYPDNSFDFVSVNGVLIHLEDMAAVEDGFMDAARLVSNQGALYTSWGPCGGLMQGVIFPALRDHYRKNDEFKNLIDNISPEMLDSVFEKIGIDSNKFGGPYIDSAELKSLFGVDYCVFLQNFIQAPTWWSNECTPEYVESLYKKAGFRNIKRLGSFTKRSDIRKYFAPLHYDTEYWLSKILYGSGYVQYVGVKF